MGPGAADEPLAKRARVDDAAAATGADPPQAPADGAPSAAAPASGAAPIAPGSSAPADGGPGASAPLPPAIAAVPLPVAAAVAPLDTYCTRELRHMERESSGELQAHYIWNDGGADSGRLLIGLKNVFSKCLPNMPKTYITRLVFDRRHRSVVIVRGGSKVIGGITYRPFHDRRFAEIAFCAVAQTLQVSGFGTRLMNWTKHFARERDGCEYFLTYADNAATGYFSKQGFTKVLSMPRDRWHGYIKDYDGGTLMECFIHPTLPFANLPGMISQQRAALDSAVRQYTTAHVVHGGLARWKEGGEGGRVPIGEIPGVREAGWTPATAAAAQPLCNLVLGGRQRPLTPETLLEFQHEMLDALEAETELVWPFLKPVDPAEVPDYYEVIKNPVAVSTIRDRLKKGDFYITLDIFVADVLRMFANARVYNAPETVFYKAAMKLATKFQEWINTRVFYYSPGEGGAAAAAAAAAAPAPEVS